MAMVVPYTVLQKGDRFTVTSPAGKTWKTTYPSEASANKAISYIESRFGTSPKGVVVKGESSPAAAPNGEDEMTGERGEKTLARMRMLQDEEGF